MPTVSVIIPAYNSAKYIRETVDSVCRQSFQDIEILVVDDGSEHDLSDLLAVYGNRVKYVRKRRSGPAATRNYGVRATTGRYIALLDHDDLWHPEYLRTQVQILDDNPGCGLVYSYPILIDEDGEVIPNEAPSRFPSGDVFFDFLKCNRITTFSATLVRRGTLESVGGLDESSEIMTCDDYDLWLRIAEVSSVAFSPGELVYYRIHAGNLLKNHDLNLHAHLKVLSKTKERSTRLRNFRRGAVEQILRENMYEKFRYFGFIKYYGSKPGDARPLFWAALRLRPLVLSNWYFLLLSFLPLSARRIAKRIRHSVCGV